MTPASIAGEPTSNAKLRLPPLVSFGSELRECASCELFVFQLAKLYAVPPQLNGVPDAEK